MFERRRAIIATVARGNRTFYAAQRRRYKAPKFDDVVHINYDRTAGWSSLVARWAHNPKVGGSNPPPATIRIDKGAAS